MQQWLILQHACSLQWPIIFHAFNSFQTPCAFIFLSLIASYIILKYMCVNFLQCWWKWVLNGIQQHIDTPWSNHGLKKETFTNFKWMCTWKSIIESYGWSTSKFIYSQIIITFCFKVTQYFLYHNFFIYEIKFYWLMVMLWLFKWNSSPKRLSFLHQHTYNRVSGFMDLKSSMYKENLKDSQISTLHLSAWVPCRYQEGITSVSPEYYADINQKCTL
jgi:hypothetical protein